MEIKWAALVLLGTIYAGKTDAAEKIRIDVYVQRNNWHQPLRPTKDLVSEILGSIDVYVTWHDGELPAVSDDGRALVGIRMSERAPASASANALAAALPYGSSGSLISIYEDRLQRLLDGLPSLSRTLLAYVFAHELAHVILGNNYHSKSGILKGAWSHADFAAMRSLQLRFTEGDSAMIRDAAAVRFVAR